MERFHPHHIEYPATTQCLRTRAKPVAGQPHAHPSHVRPCVPASPAALRAVQPACPPFLSRLPLPVRTSPLVTTGDTQRAWRCALHCKRKGNSRCAS